MYCERYLNIATNESQNWKLLTLFLHTKPWEPLSDLKLLKLWRAIKLLRVRIAMKQRWQRLKAVSIWHWVRTRMTAKCGKNKEVRYELPASSLADVLTTFWRPSFFVNSLVKCFQICFPIGLVAFRRSKIAAGDIVLIVFNYLKLLTELRKEKFFFLT